MASSTAVRSAIDDALKIVYAGPLYDDVVADSELMDLFQTEMNVETDSATNAKFIQMAHFFRWPAGVGARAENEYIPEADDPVFRATKVYLRKLQGTVEMSGEMMERVKNDESAFLNYAPDMLESLVNRVSNEADRMYVGTGKGILARINGAPGVVSTTLTIVVDTPHGIGLGYTEAWLQFLDGMRLVFSANATGSPLRTGGGFQSVKVTDVDPATNTITAEGNATLLAALADDDYIFAGDEAGFNGVTGGGDNRELQGLFAGVDDGNVIDTYLTLQRTAAGNRPWKSTVFNATSGASGVFAGAMSEDLLIYVDTLAGIRGKAKVDTIVTSYSAERGYWKSLKGDRSFINPRGAYEGGKAEKGLTIRLGTRLVTLRCARKLPPEVCFGLTRGTWKRGTFGTWHWDDTTGSIWNRVTDAVGRKHAFYGVGHLYEELACNQPRQNWRIDGLNPVQ
jgi:hypothetical protein